MHKGSVRASQHAAPGLIHGIPKHFPEKFFSLWKTDVVELINGTP